MTGHADLFLSPLDEVHRAADARMVPFGRWEMPLNYPTGTISEHLACRGGAAIFDVSHLGSLELSGTAAFGQLQAVFSNDLHRVGVGRAQYTHLLNEGDGSVVDDIIVWWIEEDRFMILPNAANHEGVLSALPGCTDVAKARTLLALQGPRSREVLERVLADAARVGRFRVSSFRWKESSGLVAGTGYTGEEGFELSVPNQIAEALWHSLVGAGAQPAGLGARDTLRLEAGLPLHGHELGPGITPLEAGLEWVVGWGKESFRGREALIVQREKGPDRRLLGLTTLGRRPPREGQAVLHGNEKIAVVTSGNFSPCLGHGIAMALLPVDLEVGATVALDQRGGAVEATVVELPFV